MYLIINSIEILFFTITLNFRCAFGYIKAYYWNIKNIKDTLKKRKEVQKKRIINDRTFIKLLTKRIGKFEALKKYGIPKYE